MTEYEPFFLFGMGNRRKLLYRENRLVDLFSGEALACFDAKGDRILPSEYTVELTLKDGTITRIVEDEQGVHIRTADESHTLTQSPLKLPDFAGHPHREMLRTLMNELLINIKDGKPYPNILVYDAPWYRDGAMAALVLEKTGNLDLIKDWVLTLDDVFDHNNDGHEEVDNIGQVLVMLAMCGAKADHPLVQLAQVALKRFEKEDHISGITDFAPHPFFQTGWVKWGLEVMGLEDPYDFPDAEDPYAPLFWMNDSPKDSIQCFEEDIAAWYPNMKVAELHYYEEPIERNLFKSTYPMTWESHGAQANYAGMSVIGEGLVKKKIGMPHTGHAAELILHLLDIGEIEP